MLEICRIQAPLIAVALLLTATDLVVGEPPNFLREVAPILAAHCHDCHAAKVRESGLDLRDVSSILRGGEGGPGVVPGVADESPLLMRIVDGEMPPDGAEPPSPQELAVIRGWIEKGDFSVADTADPWQQRLREGAEFWSFQRPVRAEIPDVINELADRVSNPIDSFILNELTGSELEPAPWADRRTLIRRAYFDLVGLPPTPEQVQAFVDDSDENAWAKVIEELLRSPHYGERWGRHWLDVARYADTGGYETDIFFRNAWRYRDYVVESFNEDKPYDRFVQEQIAGDELWPDNLDLEGSYSFAPEKLEHLEARVGTGFYALGPQIHESNMDARKRRYEELTDWVDVTAAAFLGLTVGCARCHDHKFDPISQRDYYALQAIFSGTVATDIPVVNGMEIADHKQYYPQVLTLVEARKRYRLFESRVAGRELTAEEQQDRQRLRDAIADAVLALPERAGSSPNTPWDGLMDVPTATVLGHERPELVRTVFRLSRGDLDRPREEMDAALPELLAQQTDFSPWLPGPIGSRKELALWLTQPDHPLTARVMVNRIWTWHFGQGIVSTPNDFGAMGQRPSHAALLDWLAIEFVERGWSIKEMHRLIMSSATYRQSSRVFSPDHEQRDPDNKLCWRMNRRRLEGEAVWDAIHAVAGTINLKRGGPAVMPPLVAEEMTNKANWVVNADPAEHTRRGMYIVVRRSFQFPLFEVFDAPVNSVSCAARNVSTVAPQALWLLNNHTAFGQASQFAARLLREAGTESRAHVERAFQLALGRVPTPEESAEALALLERLAVEVAEGDDHGKALPDELAKLEPPHGRALELFCLALFNLNEFLYID